MMPYGTTKPQWVYWNMLNETLIHIEVYIKDFYSKKYWVKRLSQFSNILTPIHCSAMSVSDRMSLIYK